MSFYATFNAGESRTHSVSAAHDGEAGRRAGLCSNPHGERHADVLADCIKGFSAAAMQAVINARSNELHRFAQRDDWGAQDRERHKDAMRNFASALTQIESGRMFAMNGIAATL